MTGSSSGVTSSRKYFPVEIPASRLSCLTSGSFRPKLGICILLSVLVTLAVVLVAAYNTQHEPFFNAISATDLRSLNVMAQNAKLTMVDSNNRLGGLLRPHLPQGNLVMSSYSIATVLGMLLRGAKEKSEEQILKAFNAKSEDIQEGMKQTLGIVRTFKENSNITLRSANKIYSEETFSLLPDYLEDLKRFYSTTPETLSFQKQPEKSRHSINTWVSDQTNQKIKDLLPEGSITSDARVVLVNALYFKGDWVHKFDPENTQVEDFHVDKNQRVSVKMMYQEQKFGLLENIAELDEANALQMPYKGENMDMVLVLPHKKSDIVSLEKQMAKANLSQVLGSFGPETNVELYLPKFKVESTLELNKPIQNIGITDIFDVSKADLSGMTGNKNLYVSTVIQKAFVEVNEEGAEAAAATGAVFMSKSAPMSKMFECNRPFIFLIREKSSGLVLFSGRMINPVQD